MMDFMQMKDERISASLAVHAGECARLVFKV